MERKFIVFKTATSSEVSSKFCSEVDLQLVDVVQQCLLGLVSPGPLTNTGLSCCVLPQTSWTNIKSKECIEHSVTDATCFTSDTSHLADSLHSLLDMTCTPGTSLLTILWVSDLPPEVFHPELYGALQRAVSWHNASLTILTESGCEMSPDTSSWLSSLRAECLPLSYLCPCHRLAEFLCPSLAWRGRLAFYCEDQDTGPGLMNLPGFELHTDRDALDLIYEKLDPSHISPTSAYQYSSQLEVVSSVQLASIPHHLLTRHKVLLKTPILEQDEVAQHLMEEALRSSPGQALLLKLKFSTDSPRTDLTKMKTGAWKSSVVNCNFDPAPPCPVLGSEVSAVNIVIFDDPDTEGDCSRSTCQKAGVVLRSVTDLRGVCNIRQVLSLDQKTRSERLDTFGQLVTETDLPLLALEQRKVVQVQQFVRRVQATVLEKLGEENEELLKNNSVEDILITIQDKLIADIGLYCTSQNLATDELEDLKKVDEKVSEQGIRKTANTEDWQEKRFLRFLHLHSKQSEIQTESQILKPSLTNYVVLEASQLLKFFDKEGKASRQLEPAEAKNKNCPLRPQKTKEDYEQLLADNFEKVDLDFKGYKFKGEDFSKVEFTQYHDVYYNTGVQAESYDRECKTKRDHYVGMIRETASTFSAGGEPDKLKVASTVRNSSETRKEEKQKPIVPVRRTSPRKQMGSSRPSSGMANRPNKEKAGGEKRKSGGDDITDVNRKKLRGAVYELLLRKGIKEKDALFRPCFQKLFNVCKVYIVDAQHKPGTCTKAWILEICECNVDSVIKMEKMLMKSR